MSDEANRKADAERAHYFEQKRLRAMEEEVAARIAAAVAAERERWTGWMRLALAAIDRHVPIRDIPEELDAARQAVEGEAT